MKIKVTAGTVGFYADNGAHITKTQNDAPFECPDTQAAHFVEIGAAEVAEAIEENAQKPDPEAMAHLDAEQLESYTVKELEELAAEMGVDTKGCKKKADYIALIAAEEVVPGEECTEDGEPLTDDEEAPKLDAADPE